MCPQSELVKRVGVVIVCGLLGAAFLATWAPRKARGDEPPRITMTPPLEIRVQYPPFYPHEIPYRLSPPPYPGWQPNIPSNQDIKDGVQRPNDRLEYGCWRYYSSYYVHRATP